MTLDPIHNAVVVIGRDNCGSGWIGGWPKIDAWELVFGL
jgi:hypothetical protein